MKVKVTKGILEYLRSDAELTEEEIDSYLKTINGYTQEDLNEMRKE
jgi:hypothetical protein|tara:strand:- start:327 stop:464 length:138 start_codon:yes stop_codon:yes gene_type:complete